MLSRVRRDETGAVAVLVALLAVVVFGVSALAVDLGGMYQRRRATQTTADLAALAGAQNLPDAVGARAAARDYLARNLAPGGALPAAGWDDDNLPDNGEIDITANNTRIRVVVPRRTVDFGLAGVLGMHNSSVSAAATAEIRSPRLNVLPFFLTETEAAFSYVCLKDSPKGQGGSPSCVGQTGDFGWLDIPRASGSGQTLDDNIAYGADHLLTAFPAATLPALGASCKSSTPGAVIDSGNGVTGANCVDIANGNKVSFATNGFFKGAKGTPDQGRLVDPPAGHTTGVIGRYSDVDVDTLAEYLHVPLATFLATLNNPTAGSLDASVLDCPRFAIVPVLHVATNPQNGVYAISGFRAVYLDKFDMNGGGTQLVGITAYSFSLDVLSAVISGSGAVTIPYLGAGPRVPSLVE